ncbi:hypothetical protein IHE73_11785 [Streptococcus agalactiae]|nr:hypothetical protein [Streptococcus agalactiae]
MLLSLIMIRSNNSTLEARSPMSTREITLTVDFIEKKVSGDIIAFGDWYDLDIESVNEILKQLKKTHS